MARRIVWTKAVSLDLEEAGAYIARDSRHYAAAFVHELRMAAQSLRTLSQRGRIVPEFGQQDVRELLERNYRLVYSINPKAVHILAMIHGARDFIKAWEQ